MRQRHLNDVERQDVGVPSQCDTEKSTAASGVDHHLLPRQDGSPIHHDAFGRTHTIPDDVEVFLNPLDGRLTPLKVQAVRTDDQTTKQGRWAVSSLKKSVRPHLLAVVDWIYSKDGVLFILLYPAAVAMIFVYLLCLCEIDLELQNNGSYEPVLHRSWRLPAIARNPMENANARTVKEDGEILLNEKEHPQIQRSPMPHFLCYVNNIDTASLTPDDNAAMLVDQRKDEDYVFVSYTRAQFQTYDDIDEVTRRFKYGPDHPKRQAAHRARCALLEIGKRAAQDAGVAAFWLDCFPLGEGEQDKEEVYRICDIVRAATATVVAIDTSGSMVDNGGAGLRDQDPLRDWGARMWTLPELLLSAPHKRIRVYDQANAGHVVASSKRGLGYLAWKDDWLEASQLIDHYEGTVHLSQLQLISIAHTCLRKRATIKLFKPGDVAYALMGLLRRRPQTVATDSDFMAFARLSLDNSNDAILERLLCMQPISNDAPWYEMSDAYGAQLHDIEPRCQVAAIDNAQNSQTVVLDGVFGASIDWAKLEQVPFLKRTTFWRRLTRTLLPIASFLLVLGVVLIGVTSYSTDKTNQATNMIASLTAVQTTSVAETSTITTTGYSTITTTQGPHAYQPDGDYTYYTFTSTITYKPPITTTMVSPATMTPFGADGTGLGTSLDNVTRQTKGTFGGLLAIGVILLIISFAALAVAPPLLHNLYYGKFWSTQARFYGIQGKADLADLERRLFGVIDPGLGRLKWSTSTSLLSRPAVGDDHVCVGAEPQLATVDDSTRDDCLFTLVDTFVLEATVFYAAQPPTVVMVCGQEGGMQRAVLCSYDWRTETFCREVVLRMKTIVLNRMGRVDNFRFALRRSR